jgi:hypothetical protein
MNFGKQNKDQITMLVKLHAAAGMVNPQFHRHKNFQGRAMHPAFWFRRKGGTGLDLG